MNKHRAEVVYIAAAPRSGTTILSLLLGEVPGFFNAGELRFLWRQIAAPGRCGCGTELERCAVWSQALHAAQLGQVNGSLTALVQAGKAHSLVRTLPLALAWRGVLGRLPPSMRSHLDNTLPVYQALAAGDATTVIVDSSKSPSYAYLLETAPSLRVHVLHVVRDPRAVIYSMLRDRHVTLSARLRVRLAVYQALKWMAWNLMIETCVRRRADSYTRLTYEDFAAAPRDGLRELVRRLGHVGVTLPFAGVEPNVASLTTNHTAFGNGLRFQTGAISISVDDEWRRGMPWYERSIVSALTWPLVARYRGVPGVKE